MTAKGPPHRRPLPSEYDVAFAIKEWLIDRDWTVMAFNPPGSRRAYCIPNPPGDPRYRGRGGTLAPDMIAVKKDRLLIAECSGCGKSRILSDVEKVSRLVSNKERMQLLYAVMRKACIANDVQPPRDFRPLAAVGYGGRPLVAETRKKYAESLRLLKSTASGELQNFFIEVADPCRNTGSMDASADPLAGVVTTVYSTGRDLGDVLARGPSK